MNRFEDYKWFLIGAMLAGNIYFWTADGRTNKYFVNLSVDGNSIHVSNGGF